MPFRHGRRAKRLTVGDDVRGFQELIVPETTDRAVTLVSFEYPLSELLLVQPLLHRPRDIAPTNVGFDGVIRCVPQTREPPLVDGDRECEEFRGVADDE